MASISIGIAAAVTGTTTDIRAVTGVLRVVPIKAPARLWSASGGHTFQEIQLMEEPLLLVRSVKPLETL